MSTINTDILVSKADAIISKGTTVFGSIQDLVQKGVSSLRVWTILKALINACEIVGVNLSGAEKHATVVSVWGELNKRYGLSGLILGMLPLPWYIKMFAGKILNLLIDVAIAVSVRVLNETDAWLMDEELEIEVS